jgi:hypothetical protein
MKLYIMKKKTIVMQAPTREATGDAQLAQRARVDAST